MSEILLMSNKQCMNYTNTSNRNQVNVTSDIRSRQQFNMMYRNFEEKGSRKIYG